MIIDVAGRERQIQEFAPIVEQQMQFEANEPARGTLATLRRAVKHLVLLHAVVVADGQRRGIQERMPVQSPRQLRK